MTNNSSIFSELDTSIKISVRMANGALVESKGKETIAVQTKKGMRFIKDVLLAPNLGENLLSVAQMMNHGYSLIFEHDYCIIYDFEKNEIARVTMENKSFSLQWKYPTVDANKACMDET